MLSSEDSSNEKLQPLELEEDDLFGEIKNQGKEDQNP